MPRDGTAAVFIDDRQVGLMGYHDGNTWFEYQDFAPNHLILGQAFELDPERRRNASGGVPEWFANLLPERDSALRKIILRNLDRVRIHDFALLAYLGQDLPGAVRVVATEEILESAESLANKEHVHDHPLRFSLAGMQPKFSMVGEGKALVLPVTGSGGDWIVKMPDRRFDEVPENEYSMLTWASLAGITVPEIGLVRGSDLEGIPKGVVRPQERALAVRRFDRHPSGTRTHQEDFAQVRETSVENKYERATYDGIGRVLQALCPEDVDEYIRRLVAIAVMGNLDAHLKNWTLTYPGGYTPRLSPAYDLVSVAVYPEFEEDTLAFSLGGTRTAHLVRTESFRRLSGTMQVDETHVIELVKETMSRLIFFWDDVKRDCPVPEFVRMFIDRRLTSLPLVKEL
jgi:serine/threonine-protein kinase HipA